MKGYLLKGFTGFIFFALVLNFTGCNRKTNVTVETVSDNLVEVEKPLEQVPGNQSQNPLLAIFPEDELILAVRSDYEPFMWLDSNGELTGWLVDVERTIWDELGQSYRMVPYDDVGKMGQDVKSGVAHAALAVPYTPDYEKIFNLGEPWIFMDLMVFVRQETDSIGGDTSEECIESLFGKKVGVQVRGIEYNLLREYKDIELQEYETGTVAIRKLAEGSVDAKLELMQPALYQVKNENLKIKPVGVPLMTVQGSLGFYKGLDPEIVDRYNAALKSIRENGTFDRIYKKWFGE